MRSRTDTILKMSRRVIDSAREVEETLNDVQEELDLAGQLLIENDETIEATSRKYLESEKKYLEVKAAMLQTEKKLGRATAEKIELEKNLRKTQAILFAKGVTSPADGGGCAAREAEERDRTFCWRQSCSEVRSEHGGHRGCWDRAGTAADGEATPATCFGQTWRPQSREGCRS
eukprot:TRINITY_DN4737_c0_g1_i1.p3 TRINITY_DN4737_c0_g1~~TRINITY_DN4737_c0_g1_i1.p3  ORF type:complete len:174 (+),score=26.96 TRINITY_DN4737_c0_g1_i1:35-556(+)